MRSVSELKVFTVDRGMLRKMLTDHSQAKMPIRVAALLIGFVSWEMYARTQPSYIFPTWFEMTEALVDLVLEHDLVSALIASTATVIVGFLIAVVVGVPIAFAMGLNDRVARLLNPYINGLYVAPISAFIPLILYIGGATFESRVFVVFLFAIFEIIIDTYEGISTTPSGAIEAAKAFGGSHWFVVKKVVFPHNLPYMFTGFRLGIGRGVRGMILAELLVQFSNVGALLRTMQNFFRIDAMLVLAFVVMLLGVVLTQFVKLAQNRMITWKAEVE